jgi:hypothetical protein
MSYAAAQGSNSALDQAVCGWYCADPRAVQHLGSAPLTFDALLAAGSILLSQRQLAVAHRCFCEAVRLDTRSSKPYVLLGVLYLLGGRHALALRAYSRAVALEPDLPEAWAGQGVVNELLGGDARLVEARMLYSSVAALRADLLEANLGLGRTALHGADAFQAEVVLLLRLVPLRHSGVQFRLSIVGRVLCGHCVCVCMMCSGTVRVSASLVANNHSICSSACVAHWCETPPTLTRCTCLPWLLSCRAALCWPKAFCSQSWSASTTAARRWLARQGCCGLVGPPSSWRVTVRAGHARRRSALCGLRKVPARESPIALFSCLRRSSCLCPDGALG